MPEGHTLHRLARDHHRWFGGRMVQLESPQGRFSEGARALDRCTLVRAHAIGKHLLYTFREGHIHIHLGLFGKFRVWKAARDPRPTVRLRMKTDERWLDLTGPTVCELYTDVQLEALRARLGPDPLDPEADVERFIHNLSRRRRAIGAVLLDQSVVAGIGNVYRAELLFLHRMDPDRPAKSLSRDEALALWEDMVRLLALGVQTNRIITTDPADFGKPPSRLNRHERTWVYKRRSCRVCDGSIVMKELGNRTLYYCPSCQDSSG